MRTPNGTEVSTFVWMRYTDPVTSVPQLRVRGTNQCGEATLPIPTAVGNIGNVITGDPAVAVDPLNRWIYVAGTSYSPMPKTQISVWRSSDGSFTDCNGNGSQPAGIGLTPYVGNNIYDKPDITTSGEWTSTMGYVYVTAIKLGF